MSTQLLDPITIKQDFPILSKKIHQNKQLVYLDNAATSQKPRQVIESITDYYQHSNANVHRGVHQLSDAATVLLEKGRKQIAHFFGAEPDELILTRNATEAMNGIAYGWADHNLNPGDVILTTLMEHHANIVPWQEACTRTGAQLRFIKVTPEGVLDLDDFESKIKDKKVKLLTFAHISNTLGTLNPVEQLVRLAKKHNPDVRIVVDGAQSAPHIPVSFSGLGIDFFAFSGHKMLAPMGVGGLLVNKKILKTAEMRPWLFGGGMISSVLPEKADFNPDLAEKFTAGTPDVASVVGLAAACRYLTDLDMKKVAVHDQKLVEYALEKLSSKKNIRLVGPMHHRLGSVAFIHIHVHAHDVAQVVDSQGVAVRSGHHCCMPLHTQFGWQATVRASFSVYNTHQDIDQLCEALDKVDEVFGV